jgi:hypothetical protein
LLKNTSVCTLQGYNTRGRTVPVMVAIHGAGGDGRDMINAFMVMNCDGDSVFSASPTQGGVQQQPAWLFTHRLQQSIWQEVLRSDAGLSMLARCSGIASDRCDVTLYLHPPLQALADKYRFVIIAPQSHDLRGWLAVQDSGRITPFTDDVKHVVGALHATQRVGRAACSAVGDVYPVAARHVR